MSEPRSYSRFKVGGTLVLLVCLAVMGAMIGSKARAVRAEARIRLAEQEAGPRVRVAVAKVVSGPRVFTVEAEALPYLSTTLYAKLSGYLKEIRVDKGTRVRSGEVMAVLESPETHRDTLALKAAAENKRRDADRMARLGKERIVSPQDVDDAEAVARVAEEQYASQAIQEDYQIMRAPFAGVVTQRLADPGALLQNAALTTTAQPLITVSQVDRLRITFYLDSEAAALVRQGQAVDVCPVGRPDLVRQAVVSRQAGALDVRTRTLLVEADLDNRDGAFLTGGYVQVRLKVPVQGERLLVPVEAVFERQGRTCAAVVGPDSRLRIQTLATGEVDQGQLRILAGLRDGDRVVLSPGASAKDGDKVRVVESR
jgi:RND family efflux transporter MFP subunit